MGWLKQDNGRPRIFSYNGSDYVDPEPLWFTWMTGNLWDQFEECACFVNDTNYSMILRDCGIGICACDSGGKGYWIWGGYRNIPAKGYGAEYTMYTRVMNPGKPVEESDKCTVDIPNIGVAADSNYDNDGKLLAVNSNMNSPGWGPRDTARFGDPPYGEGEYSKYTGITLKTFEISNCPVVEPGGKLYLHLRIRNFKGPKDNVTIKFILDPHQMDINIEPVELPYIWLREKDKKWHLRQPLYVIGENHKWEGKS